VAIGILAAAPGPGTTSIAGNVVVSGHSSANVYKKVYFPQATGSPYTALWIDRVDTQADFTVDNTGGGFTSDTYYLIAYPFVPGTVGSPVENGTPPFAGTVIPPAIGQIVTMNGTTPAPWQASTQSATSRAVPGALNTDFTIIPAPGAGLSIYLHSVVVNTNTGGTWEVDLWDGPSAGGVKIADLFTAVMTAVGAQPPVNWDGHGRKLAANSPLVGTIATGAAGATVFGTYGYEVGP
jgi:hypothetical protein